MRNSRRNDGTPITKIACAVVFCVFTFSYLYFFQAGLLTVTQHVLSHGVTHYDGMVGALIITVVLFSLQRIVFVATRLYGKSHALTYFPSILLLSVLTSVDDNIDMHLSWGAWVWAFPLLVVLWLALVSLARRCGNGDDADVGGLWSRSVCVNVFVMVAMMLFVGFVGNGKSVFHYRADAEVAMKEGDFDKALGYGKRSLETDRSLTMIRAYALAREGKLADELFNYAVEATSADLVPMKNSDGEVRFYVYPADSLYRLLGARPLDYMTTRQYLSALLKSGQATPVVKDYVLCGYLLDRDLDGFARNVVRYYNVNDSLPRHYKEALTLYTHSRSNPVVVYHNEVMDTDFDDFQRLNNMNVPDNERALRVFDQYQHTYWYYWKSYIRHRNS